MDVDELHRPGERRDLVRDAQLDVGRAVFHLYDDGRVMLGRRFHLGVRVGHEGHRRGVVPRDAEGTPGIRRAWAKALRQQASSWATSASMSSRSASVPDGTAE